MDIKNKRVLITAGPTWVPVDSVRVISNIATGKTGIAIAQRLAELGARVTLLLGPVLKECCPDSKIKVLRFTFFDELKSILLGELKFKKYDIVIHSAAVSDYRPLKSYGYKIKSGRKIWRLNLVPAPKVINLIKNVDKNLFLVGFKFEPKASREILIDKARNLMRQARLDIAIANTVCRNRYQAYIVGQNKIQGHIRNKKDLAEKLIQVISEEF